MAARAFVSPIALVGLSGAGKSTVARLLAARLGVPALDLDQEIERETGRDVPDLFAREGEAAFRRLEVGALERAMDQGAGVIACGGGVVETESAREILRDRCRVVWLEVGPDAAAERVQDGAPRPLLGPDAPRDRLRDLLARRAAWYGEVARVRVATDGIPADAVAERILQALERDIAAGSGR